MRIGTLPFVAGSLLAAVVACVIFFPPKREPEVQQQQPLRILTSNEQAGWFRWEEWKETNRQTIVVTDVRTLLKAERYQALTNWMRTHP